MSKDYLAKQGKNMREKRKKGGKNMLEGANRDTDVLRNISLVPEQGERLSSWVWLSTVT